MDRVIEPDARRLRLHKGNDLIEQAREHIVEGLCRAQLRTDQRDRLQLAFMFSAFAAHRSLF